MPSGSNTGNPYNAAIDAQQYPSLTAVSGTTGTADVNGTAEIVRVGVNPTTGALYVDTSTTPGGGAVVSVTSGTLQTLGTVGTINGIGGTVQTSGPLSVISTNNSSTAVLAGNAVFTGTGEDVTAYSEMRVSVWSSHISGSDGLSIQQSSDNTNWDITDVYNIAATTGKTYVVPRQAKFFRIVYTNGATLQTGFRLQVILNKTATTPASQRSSDGYSNETDLQEVWAFNSIWNGATWDRAKGTSGTAFVAVGAGTQQTLGTVGVVNTGTLAQVTNLTNGSVNILTGTIQNSGNGTVVNGSIIVTTGTILSSGAGTVVGGTLQNLVTGTINALAAGTITAGTLTNLVSGTLNALASGTITVGTVSVTTGTVVLNTGTITTIAAGTQNTLGTVGNLNNGSVNLLTGTLTSITNLAGGTIKSDPTTVPQMLQFGTLGTAGGSFFATISAASGAGTKHYIQGVDIVMQSGIADVRVLSGSSVQGTGVLAAGFFGTPGGGISKNWAPHFNTGTNSELIYHFVGAGTAFINVSYWKGA